MYQLNLFPKEDTTRVGDYFQAFEFDCKGKEVENTFTLISPTLVYLLDGFRRKLQRPIQILSGYRTVEHNRNEGGSKNSKHMEGIAADWYVPGMHIASVGAFLAFEAYPTLGGYRVYLDKGFIHTDVRERVDGKLITWGG